MRRIRVLAMTGLALAALATPAQAESATTHRAATTADAARAVTAFWTPERMRSAQPLDLIDAAPKAMKDVPRGAPAEVPGVGIQSFPNGGAAWTGGGAVVNTAGRVFFTY